MVVLRAQHHTSAKAAEAQAEDGDEHIKHGSKYLMVIPVYEAELKKDPETLSSNTNLACTQYRAQPGTSR